MNISTKNKIIIKLIITMLLIMLIYVIIGALIFFLEFKGTRAIDLSTVLNMPMSNIMLTLALLVMGFLAIIYIVWINPSRFNVNIKDGKPAASSQNTHGSARLLSDSEKRSIYGVYDYKKSKQPQRGGLVFGKSITSQKVYYDKSDTHAIIIGSTGSGKTRRVLLPTINLIAKSGESMVIADPKRELFAYTYPYLKKHGYNVINLDLRDTTNSIQWNPLKPVRDAIKSNNIDRAQIKARELVTILVPDHPKTEPIWINGERAVLEACILYVCCDAENDEEATLYNVYTLLTKYGEPDEKGNNNLSFLFSKLDDTHPAKRTIGIAELSHQRTRASFYTSACSSLLMFNSIDLAELTQRQTIDFDYIGNNKTALFLNIPDERKDLHKFACMAVNQVYLDLFDTAQSRGGRLERDVMFLLDEFGNLPKIPDFVNKLTMARSLGIRFCLAVQDLAQLETVYGKDQARTIKGNLNNIVYLRTTDYMTADELSKRTGNYTIESYSSGISQQTDSLLKSTSQRNVSVMGRALYLTQEILYYPLNKSLVFTSGQNPAEFYSPDLCEWQVNKEFQIGQTAEDNLHIIQNRLNNLTRRKKDEVFLYVPSLFKRLKAEMRSERKQSRREITDEQIFTLESNS